MPKLSKRLKINFKLTLKTDEDTVKSCLYNAISNYIKQTYLDINTQDDLFNIQTELCKINKPKSKDK